MVLARTRPSSDVAITVLLGPSSRILLQINPTLREQAVEAYNREYEAGAGGGKK